MATARSSAGARRRAVWEGEGDAPLLDLTSGYIRRGAHLLPRQGHRRPWRVVQSYPYDLTVMRLGRIDDGHLDLH